MNKLNLKAEALNIEALNDQITALRNSHRALTTMDETVAEAQKRDNELKLEMQEALDKNDLDKIQKVAAERKRIAKKLGEGPEEKQKQFDEAVDKLVEIFTTVHAVEEPEGEEAEEQLEDAA